MTRTPLQREANELDMDMHRMIGRLEDFATRMHVSRVEPVDIAANAMRDARWRVRELMYALDVERTK